MKIPPIDPDLHLMVPHSLHQDQQELISKLRPEQVAGLLLVLVQHLGLQVNAETNGDLTITPIDYGSKYKVH